MPPEERLDMSRTKKQATEAAVREIHRRTRRKFAPEEKIRIVLEGLRGEESISELCRREGIADHTGHRSLAMVRVYTRRSDAFADHAGDGLL